jgi:hypothetical protein
MQEQTVVLVAVPQRSVEPQAEAAELPLSQPLNGAALVTQEEVPLGVMYAAELVEVEQVL